MAHFSSDHFSGTVRTTKDVLKHGPLDVRRLNTLPVNTFGRNGDLVIVDNTATESPKVAENRIPTTVSLCQKVPFPVTPGTFTITTAAGVFTITIVTIDDVVEQIRLANIPGLTIEFEPRGGILVHSVPATWADGTSNLPSITGTVGAQVGNYPIITGEWKCFPVGSFGAQSYGSITGGDGGTTVAVLASEIITFAGTGVNIVGVDSGVPGSDSIAFTLDVADLPPFTGTVLPTDEIAIDNSGTTERVTVAKFLEDVDIPVIPGTGVVIKVSSGPDVWATRTIVVDGLGALDGLVVADGDGVAGDPTIGLDIQNLPARSDAVDVADRVAVWNSTSGANEYYTVGEVSSAAFNLGFASITGADSVASELMPFVTDATRSKDLTITESMMTFGADKFDSGDLLLPHDHQQTDLDSGYIMPYDGTIVRASVRVAQPNSFAKTFGLGVDGAFTATVLSTAATAPPADDVVTDVDIDFDAGEHLQAECDGGDAGESRRVVLNIWVKWRNP